MHLHIPALALVLIAAPGCGDGSAGQTDGAGSTITLNTGGEAGAPTGTQASEMTGLNEMTGGSGVGEGPGMTVTAGTSDEAGTSGGTGGTSIDPETGGPAATYWHIEPPVGDGRTWLMSPGGERVFMLGVNTTMRGKECDGMDGWIGRHPPTKSAQVE